MVTLSLSSNVAGGSNNESNFPHKLLLNYAQVSRICKSFANGSSANITQLSKLVQLGRVIRDIPIFDDILLNTAKNGTYIARYLVKDFLDKQIERFNKEYIR